MFSNVEVSECLRLLRCPPYHILCNILCHRSCHSLYCPLHHTLLFPLPRTQYYHYQQCYSAVLYYLCLHSSQGDTSHIFPAFYSLYHCLCPPRISRQCFQVFVFRFRLPQTSRRCPFSAVCFRLQTYIRHPLRLHRLLSIVHYHIPLRRLAVLVVSFAPYHLLYHLPYHLLFFLILYSHCLLPLALVYSYPIHWQYLFPYYFSVPRLQVY